MKANLNLLAVVALLSITSCGNPQVLYHPSQSNTVSTGGPKGSQPGSNSPVNTPDDPGASEKPSSGGGGSTSGSGGGSGHSDGCHNGHFCNTQTFPRTRTVENRSADILIVSDTSGSLNPERAAIASDIAHLIAQLPSRSDYRVAVMPGHGSTSKWAGRLYAKTGQPVVLDSEKLSTGKLTDLLRARLQSMPTDQGSDGGEELMYSLLKGLSPEQLQESVKHGFFRKNAALIVLFVTDENDICFNPQDKGYTTWPHFVSDSDRIEPVAYRRDCVLNGKAVVTPETVLKQLQQVKTHAPLLLGGFVYTDPKTIRRDGENSIGHGILELVQKSGGVLADLASHDYRAALARIGELSSSRMQPRQEVRIRIPQGYNLIPASVQVWLGERPVHARVEGTRIILDESCGARQSSSPIRVRYCVEAAE